MNLKRYLTAVSLVALLFVSCKKDDEGANNFSCEGVANALVANDVAGLKAIIDPLMTSFHSPVDANQARNQLESIAEFLSECKNLKATFICFECVQTLPAQSEISVEVKVGSSTVTKIIDFIRENNGSFKVANIHN